MSCSMLFQLSLSFQNVTSVSTGRAMRNFHLCLQCHQTPHTLQALHSPC